MASTAFAFGFQPASSPTGDLRTETFRIASGYAANIFNGDPVRLNTSGVLVLATSDGTRSGTTDGIPVLGIFQGCRFRNSVGDEVISQFWPTGTTITQNDVDAYVILPRDSNLRVQFTNPSPGTTVQAFVGAQADWVVASPGGNTRTGISTTALTASQATRGQFIIKGFERNTSDLLTDGFVTALVQFNEQNFSAAVNVVS
jgi:hypothetical protein